MIATFFASFAFFGAVIFLPRWFQIVQGFSPTWSGLAALPLMVGLIGSSITSGLVVARTGRYKWLMVGALIVMGVATLLMTQLRADTPLPIVWSWMFIAGLGVGPTFAVFTLIVQNAVPFRELGVATSNLTFFRQIGGTISLAIVGTMFAAAFENQLAPSMTAAGVPGPLVTGFSQGMQSGAFDFNQLTGVGDLGTAILQNSPPQLQGVIQPFIPNIVQGIHQAFSLAVSETFWVGVVAAAIAAVAAAGMHELALRRHHAPGSLGAGAGQQGGAGRPTVPAAD
jgi:MFS family permease